ncbi:unnamed protein product [Moneuplotes crassus]|uniref:Uncharacterized protein n=1 Tax=Euplotes crassus TaxID=5936 RepID=A0AAD1X696_EUPCR|nr:unnamed protein product [Moneuplotes crassus]
MKENKLMSNETKVQTMFSNKRISNGFESVKTTRLNDKNDLCPPIYPKILRPSHEIMRKINVNNVIKKFKKSFMRNSRRIIDQPQYVTDYQRIRKYKSYEKIARARRLASLNSKSQSHLYGNYKHFVNKIKSGNLQKIKHGNTNFSLRNPQLRLGAFSPALTRGLFSNLSNWEPANGKQIKSIVDEVEKPIDDSPMRETVENESSESSLSQRNIKYTTIVRYFSDSKEGSTSSSEISEDFKENLGKIQSQKKEKNFAKYIDKAVKIDLYHEAEKDLAHKPDPLQSMKDIESIIEREKWKKEHYDKIKSRSKPQLLTTIQSEYYRNKMKGNNKYMKMKKNLSKAFNISERRAPLPKKKPSLNTKFQLKELYSPLPANTSPGQKIGYSQNKDDGVKIGTRVLQKRFRKQKY